MGMGSRAFAMICVRTDGCAHVGTNEARIAKAMIWGAFAKSRVRREGALSRAMSCVRTDGAVACAMSCVRCEGCAHVGTNEARIARGMSRVAADAMPAAISQPFARAGS